MGLQDATRPLVVVADDRQVNQMLMRASLEAKGFDSIVVADGAEAVALVRGNRLDRRRALARPPLALQIPLRAASHACPLGDNVKAPSPVHWSTSRPGSRLVSGLVSTTCSPAA